MSEKLVCVRCGTAVDDGDGRVCPACLLAMAAESNASDAPTITHTGSASFEASEVDADGGVRTRLESGQFFGPYRIERLLGKGGMGEVYEAVHLIHERRVALKILSQRMADAEDRERFLREGQVAASINHPNSVYVFGSEEIAGVPAISMELMPGGTLKDRVQANGPFRAEAAVDAILEVIAGLEAAAQAGILHRDIKPSNCFVDADGTVKVGDFGLSISTLTRHPTLTEEGSILGTPAYASPEQLKGRPLDVRSDIYAVGATLYYLLSGEAPLDGDNVVEVISRVVGEPHRSLRELRRDVPHALSRIVDRCLAKQPEQRYTDYVALRAALASFATGAVKPAPPGLRVAAYVIDTAIVAALLGLAMLIDMAGARLMPESIFGALRRTPLTEVVLWLTYFALTEGLTGASLGKMCCGLRVTRERSRAPFWRVIVRVGVWCLVSDGWRLVLSLPATPRGSAIGLSLYPLATLVLFSTARRANGYAGLHDWLSGTRVIAERGGLQQTTWTGADSLAEPATLGGARVGPYVALDPIAPNISRAFDPRLKRLVWIVRSAEETGAADRARRALARPTRLRWLNSGRDGAGVWDAYEEPAGVPWREATPRPWSTVSRWMAALASECDAANAEGTLPRLRTGGLWIGPNDRIKLLDWDVTSADTRTSQRASGSVVEHVSSLLSSVASRSAEALGGIPLGADAGAFVRRLDEGAPEDVRRLAVEAATVARRPAVVTRAHRRRHLIIVSALPAVLVASTVIVGLSPIARQRDGASDERKLVQAIAVIDLLEQGDRTAVRDEQLRLARVHARSLLQGPVRQSFLSSPLLRSLTRAESAVLRRVEEGPGASADEIARARDLMTHIAVFGNEPVDVLRLVDLARVVAQPHGEQLDVASYRVGCAALLAEFGPLLRQPTFWDSRVAIPLHSVRDRITPCVGDPPALSADEWAVVSQLRASANRGVKRTGPVDVTFAGFLTNLPSALSALITVVTGFGLMSALLFRGGLVLRRLGIAMVTADGRRASAARVAARSLAAWSPGVVVFLASSFGIRGALLASVVALGILAVAAGMIAAVVTPSRGLQDRLAGTYLVPE